MTRIISAISSSTSSIGLTRADSFGDGISLRQLLYFEKEFDESKNLLQVKIGNTISPMNFKPP